MTNEELKKPRKILVEIEEIKKSEISAWLKRLKQNTQMIQKQRSISKS